MGLLSDISEEVARRGAEIIGLIKSGRADEITDQMLNLGDPVANTRLNEYLYQNYDLPMDAASRMERRDAGGFNAGQPLYRGDQNPDALAFGTGQFAREGIGVTASDSPNVAATYMTGNTPAMYPLYARAERPLAVDVGGRNWTGIPAEADTNMGRLDAVLAPESYLDEANLFDLLHGNKVDWGDGTATGMAMANTDNVARAAQAAGFDQVQFRDIVDRGGAAKYSTEAANTPHTTFMTSDPRNIRSAFARFDPRLRHLDNLNAGVAGAAAAGAGLLGYGDEANAMPAPQTDGAAGAGDYSLGYRDTLGQLYATDGGVMYPKGTSADGLLATDTTAAPEAPQQPLSAFDEALRYYLGPTGIPERIVAANEVLNPVRGLERGMQASQQALDPNSGLTGWERVGAGADAATETLGALLGLGGTKAAAKEAAPLIEDALTAAARYGADEAGSVPIPRINKEILDPLGYQKTKMRDYLSNTQLDLIDAGENLPRTPASWEDMTGRLVIPLYGDRSSRGMLLGGIDDTKFDTPVYTEGGVDFKRGPAAQKDRAVWASNNSIITRIANEADKARAKYGESDVYGMTGTMAPDANDFATFTGATMAEMVKNAPIKKADASKFDEIMRAIDPDFVGIKSPALRQWAETTSSPNRKSFIRLMDSAPMQAAGFPSPAQARYGVTDVTQRDMPAGLFGLGVSKLDEVSPVLSAKPKGNAAAASVPHSTYNTQITGDYFGSLPPVPQSLIFRDVYGPMEGGVTKSGQPYNEAHKTHAIKTIMPVQRLNEPIIQGILDYLARQEK